MKQMQSEEIRSRFLKFFSAKGGPASGGEGHKIIPSASLVPENDPSVLFTTAGMQQFKLYYTGEKNAEKDFETKNVVSVQKCIRTSDIDEVGDDTHNTFFEMLGNFSFGGYWKKEAIEYAYEFITQELELTIDYVSVFEGDAETSADNESREIWKNINPKLVIKNHNRADNFWGPTGDEGPCGPTTEIYINGVEIWNIVFNEFYKTKEGKYEPLKIKGIDTGMGLERLLVQVQKKNNIYETDLFNNEKTREERIVADHVKAALFMIS
ncbi:MAG: Alanine-tRNA ligase, partial [Candidatus Nomurabacteria bacterium GW2011_GWA2_41_25]